MTAMQDLIHSAAIIRSDLLDVQASMSWPPDIYHDFADEEVWMIPASPFNLLAWINDGVDMAQPIPQRHDEHVKVRSPDVENTCL